MFKLNKRNSIISLTEYKLIHAYGAFYKILEYSKNYIMNIYLKLNENENILTI